MAAQFHYTEDQELPYCRTVKYRGRLTSDWGQVDCGSCCYQKRFKAEMAARRTEEKRPCYLYLITASDNQTPVFAKIGISFDVDYRLSQLDQGPLFLDKDTLVSFPSEAEARAAEKQVHASLAIDRFNGEWFRWVAGVTRSVFLLVAKKCLEGSNV